MVHAAERDLDSSARALALLDRLTAKYKKSGLRDDALWHSARLARAAGDAAGAAKRLRTLLATREVAFGAGSYFSIWLDDAQLELGRVLRDDLGDFNGALRAFQRLSADYPTSLLRDDALFEEAVTLAEMDRKPETCKTLGRLAKAWPESKYFVEKAPALAKSAQCPSP